MAKRSVSNPLALAVLTFLASQPMYPYEIATALRNTGKEQVIKINWGSLYTVVQSLHKHGFISEAGTSRQGGRPERTAYTITESGRAEMRDWLRELLAEPQQEHPLFAAALSLMGVLSPDEAIEMLTRRLAALESAASRYAADLDALAVRIPRLFLIETEYLAAMCRAEIAWVQGLLADLAGAMLPLVDQWREFHQTGRLPAEFAGLFAEILQEAPPPD